MDNQALSEIAEFAKSEPHFFDKFGNDLISLNGWLGEPKFTVNELVAAIEAKIRSNK